MQSRSLSLRRDTVSRSYLLDDILNVIANGPLVPASTPALIRDSREITIDTQYSLGLSRPPPAAVPQYPEQRADRDRAGQVASGDKFAEGRCHLGVEFAYVRNQLHRPGATVELSRVAFGA